MRNQIVNLSACLLGIGLMFNTLGCGLSTTESDVDKADVEPTSFQIAADGQHGKQTTRNETGEIHSELTSLEPLQGDSLTDLVSQLGRLKPGPALERAITQLARGGDATTNEIEQLSSQPSSGFVWVHTSVRVLERINTEKSRALLKKFCLGEIKVENPNLQGWAARALIACDQNQARALLSSSEDEVLATAILSLRGQGLDQDLMDSLKPHIQSENPYIRWIVAGIMASEAPTGELADQALNNIKEALIAVAKIADIEVIDPSTGRVNYKMTFGEAYYQRYMSMLPQLRVENSALRRIAEQLQGRARDTVLLALAFRDDSSVHDEIVKLAQDDSAGMFRAWAASALPAVGTVDDLPLLRRLAETDPLVRGGGGYVLPRNRSNYPVRERARQALKTIQRAANQEK